MHSVFDVKMTLLVSCIAGLISGYLAYKRGKNPTFWFFIGTLFGLFGVFAFFFLSKPKKQPAPLPEVRQPEPYLLGPADKFWYYLDASHSQVGPLSYNGLKSGWKQGTIPLSAFVWHEDLTEWTPLQELIRIK
jgi:hypothetical protein